LDLRWRYPTRHNATPGSQPPSRHSNARPIRQLILPDPLQGPLRHGLPISIQGDQELSKSPSVVHNTADLRSHVHVLQLVGFSEATISVAAVQEGA
jgi:hypothetical protein